MRLRTIFMTCLLLASSTAAQAQAPTKFPIAQDALLSYLDQMTQWQRDAAILEPSATNVREVVFRDSLRDNASNVLKNGFTFMRSVASIERAASESDPQSTRLVLMARAKAMREKIAALEARAAKAPANQRAAIRDEIRLEQARLELSQTILANLNSASNKSPDKLSYTLDSIARATPELNDDAKATAPVAAPVAIVKRSSTSLIALSMDAFDVTRKQGELTTMIAQTTQLKKDSMNLMKALRSGLGEDVPAEEGSEKAPPPSLTVDEQVTAYKQLGATIIPLGTTMRWIDASKQTLQEWQQVLLQHRDTIVSQLAVRFFALLLTLAIPLGIGELVRRALKHVPDSKRKNQLNMIRRILTSMAVFVILLLYFISDFSSFATFAGFLTAGLAVALQSPLLSLVAHFLFYGRYGVRQGDRVVVTGVTGDIMKIGMVRFHIRELKEGANGLEPTGKIVAFPNSVLFQNQAFYKFV